MIHIKRLNEMANTKRFSTSMFEKVCKLVDDTDNDTRMKNDIFGWTGITDMRYCYLTCPVFEDADGYEIYYDSDDEEHSYGHNFSKVEGAEMLQGFSAVIDRKDYVDAFIKRYDMLKINGDIEDRLDDFIGEFADNYRSNDFQVDHEDEYDYDLIVISITPDHTMSILAHTDDLSLAEERKRTILSLLQKFVKKFHNDLDAEILAKFRNGSGN